MERGPSANTSGGEREGERAEGYFGKWSPETTQGFNEATWAGEKG